MIGRAWLNQLKKLFSGVCRPVRTRVRPTRRVPLFGMEWLEDRVVPATISLVGDELRLIYTGTSENVTLTNNGTNIVATGSASGSFAVGSVASIAVTDPSNLNSQNLILAGTTPFNLSGGFSSTGVEWVRFENAVATSGTAGISVIAPVRVWVSANLTAGTSGITLAGQGKSTSVSDWGLGINIYNGAVISTAGGDIAITGKGASPTSPGFNYGVLIQEAAQVVAGGTGNITISGTGGASLSETNIGFYIREASLVRTEDGDITITGVGGGTSASHSNDGVYIGGGVPGTLIAAGGSGKVTISGTGGATSGGKNEGVEIVSESIITSEGGDVSVVGFGGAGAGAENRGVRVLLGSVITAGGNGAVSVTGTGGGNSTAGSFNYGVQLDGTNSRITSSGGDVTVEGFGGTSGGTSSTNAGVHMGDGGIITAGGTGTVTVTGTGGQGTSDVQSSNFGVTIQGTGTSITSAGGAVSVTGFGGGKGSASNYGVWAKDGGTITAGGLGSVAVVGKGGATPFTSVTARDENHGVLVSGTGAAITSSGGTVTVTGTGGKGAGASSANFGVSVASAGQITAGGTGTVTVTGTGGSGTGGFNRGVFVKDLNSTIHSGGGAVAVTGIGGFGGSLGTDNHGVNVGYEARITSGSNGTVAVNGTGGASTTADFNYGVNVFNAGQITSGGNGTVTVNGTGGASGSGNLGLRVGGMNAKITSGGGAVVVVGQGGGTGAGNSNNGMLVDTTGVITAGGSGTVTVVGNGGSSGSASYGIWVQGVGSAITSGGGAVSATGKGNSSSEAVRLETSGAITSGANATITVTADSVNILSSGSINSGTGTTTIQPRTAGTLVNLGAADVLSGSPLTLGLTDAELDAVTAGTLIVGAANAGTMTVSAAITHGNNLELLTGGGITVNQPITIAANRSLTATSGSTSAGINLAMASSDISASGTGTISLTAARNINLVSGASITTVDGNLTLSANQQTTPTVGNFIGVNLFDATITTTSGSISIQGRGGSTGAENIGVQIRGNSLTAKVESTGTGTVGDITIIGTGGAGANDNYGVLVYSLSSGAGEVRSVDAAIVITGTGQGTAEDNFGVYLSSSGTVISTGVGAIDIEGTGSVTGTTNNNGVFLGGSTPVRIESKHGDLHIHGFAGGSSAPASGLAVAIGTNGTLAIASSGTGSIEIVANSLALQATSMPMATIDAGANTVTIRQQTNDFSIDLGGADSPTQLGLTDAELDRITAGTLIVGAANAGSMTVSANITRPAATDVELHSGGDVLLSGGSIDTAGGTLLLAPGASPFAVRPTRAGTDAAASSVAFASDLAIAINGTTLDTDYHQLNVTGTVDLTGVDLVLSGTHTPQPGDVFTIVAATSVTGTFTGLPHGSEIIFNGETLTVEYTATSVTLSAPVPGTLTVVLDGSGNLIVTDTAGVVNELTLAVVAGALTLTDASEQFIAAPTGWTRSADGRSISTPAAGFSKAINIIAAGGNDTLTIDLSGGDAIPLGGVNFDGGSGTDAITITGGTQGDATFTYTGAESGSVSLENFGTISFTGAQELTNNGTMHDVIFDLLTTAFYVSLSDDGIAGNGLSRLVEGYGLVPTTTFHNPTNGVTIYRGATNAMAVMWSVPDLTAGVVFGTETEWFDSVNILGAVNIGAGSFVAYGRHVDIAAALSAGDILLDADTGGQMPGNFTGVALRANVTASGTLSVEGRGGGTTGSGGNYGVMVWPGVVVSTVGGGAVAVTGTGGEGNGTGIGVLVTGTNAAITSDGGDITVTGIGGGSGSATSNHGVAIRNGGRIAAGGSGYVEITGTGGMGTGNSNYGIQVMGANSMVASSGGDVTVTGTGGGSGTSGSNTGVRVESGGQISAGGTGNVLTDGTGGLGAGGDSSGVLIRDPNSLITSSGGNVAIIGTGGGSISTFQSSRGVELRLSGSIRAQGLGTIGITGVGGLSTGNSNVGVVAESTTMISSSGGAIAVTGMSGSTDSYAAIIHTISTGGTGGDIAIVADSLAISTGGSLDAGTGTVTISPLTTGTNISLGSDDVITGSLLRLGLTDAELDRITAGTLILGAADAGSLSVTNSITRPSATAVELHSGGDVFISGLGTINTAGGTLLFSPGPSPVAVLPTRAGTDAIASTVTIDGALAIQISGTTVDTGYHQLNVTGAVDLTGASLALIGSHVPQPGSTFTIVAATSVSGTFTGLPHGSVVTFNGVPLTVLYSPTSVTLSAPVPGTLTAVLDGSGNLIVTDTAGVVNELTLAVVAGALTLTDANEQFIAAPAGWTRSADGRSISYTGPGTFTPTITIDGAGGSDTLTVHLGALSGPLAIVDTGTSGIDRATLIGTAAPDTFEVNTAAAGGPRTIAISPTQQVTYTAALEELTLDGADGGDTFNVTPDAATALTVNGGNPTGGVGDTLNLNVLGVLDMAIASLVLNQPALPDGRLTSSNRQSVEWTSIENFPVPLGLGGRFDFQPTRVLNDPNQQPGFHAIVPSDTPTFGAFPANPAQSFPGIGWVQAGAGAFDRVAQFGAAGNPGGPLSLLLRDSQWGWNGGGANDGVFQVAVAPNQALRVTVFVGDTYAARDTTDVYIGNPTVGFTLMNLTPTALNTQPGNGPYVSYWSGFNPGPSNILQIKVSARSGGSSAFWTISGVDVRPLTLHTLLAITRDGGSGPVVADGTTETSYTVTGAAPGAILAVSATQGTIASADQVSSLGGNQVLADTNGSASFVVRSPLSTAGIIGAIFATDATGASAGALDQTYTAYTLPESPPPGAGVMKRFDFNSGASPTQPGFISVLGGETYSTARGFGWSSAVSGYDRQSGGNPVALYRDGHWGTGSGIFRIAANAGTYDVRVYVGDPYSPWSGITVTAGGMTRAIDPVLNRFGYVTIYNVSAVGGVVSISINAPSTTSYWVVAGIDFATAGGLPAPATGEAALVGVKRIDFNAGSVTAPGFLGVSGTMLYTPIPGHGWHTSVSVFDRGTGGALTFFSTAQQALYRDAAYAQGTRVFKVAVPSGASNTFQARVYVGDSYTNWPGITLQMEGGPVVNVNTSANPFWSYILNGADVNGDGTVTITVGGPSYWVINGIEIVQTGGTSTGTLPPSIGPGLAPQLAAEGAVKADRSPMLTSEQLAPIAAEAIRRWEATGLTPTQVALLRSVQFEIGDLGDYLGLTSLYGNLVRLDDDGAGRGWYIDATPHDDVEFANAIGSTQLRATDHQAVRGYDLLTVVMHELGHTLGLDSRDASTTPHDLMTATLPLGTRRVLMPSEAPVKLWLNDDDAVNLGIGSPHRLRKS